MEIRISIDDPGTLQLVREWQERQAHLRRLVPYLAARRVQEEIAETLPNEKGVAALKSSLRVGRIGSFGEGVFAYSVFADVADAKVDEVDAADTIIYVQTKKLTIFIPEEVKVLEEFGPWTMTTLPFMPDRKHAIVISRRVPKKVVLDIERDRKNDKFFWNAKLQRAGVRKQMKIEKPAKTTAVPDVAFLSMRYEFGLGGLLPKPHWRPGILGFVRSLPGLFATSKIKGILGDPANNTWRKRPKTDATISTSRAKDFVPFQRALGIQVGKK